MSESPRERENAVRYEPDETAPPLLALGLAFQFVALAVAGIVITVVIVGKAAGQSSQFIAWATFASLLVAGSCTALQAKRIWRFGSGHVLLMGTSAVFIAVCVSALESGGPALMAVLIIISSAIQFMLAFKLSWLRNIITPAVSGTVIMLIPLTVMPIVYDLLTDVPAGHENTSAPIVAFVTIVVAAGLAMRATGMWRLWTPILGMIVGTIVAAFLGVYDARSMLEADWFGVPDGGWEFLDLSFGREFWLLLPGFIFVTVVGMVETIGDSVGIQRVSRRSPGAPDYRVVQGAIGADGVGNLLSGILCTVPNTTYSSSIAVTELTGVGSRQVGVFIGLIFVVLAFLPKFQELIIGIPNPVAGAYLGVILALLFIVGMRIAVRDGLDYRKAIIVGLSLWVGLGFQFGLIFPGLMDGEWSSLLQNGMTTGGITAIVLTVLMRLLSSRTRSLVTTTAITKLDAIQNFLGEAATAWGWSDRAINRLKLAAEETVLTLTDQTNEESEKVERSLRVSIKRDIDDAIVEFAAVAGEGNIEDRLLLLEESDTTAIEQDLSLRILRQVTSSFRHQQYFDTDVITITVSKS